MNDNSQGKTLVSVADHETESTENRPIQESIERISESEVRIFNRNDKLIKKLIESKEEGRLSDKEYIEQLNRLINPAI